MMKFEHEVDTIDLRKKTKEMPATLARRSAEGWELVSVFPSHAVVLPPVLPLSPCVL